MSTDSARDPFLDLDLDGVRLIEASAGTGKTYTLATLVTRLVIERGLRVGQILAVTFTDAATQALRERLRRRLLLAARIAADDPALPAAGDDAERALTRAMIAAQRRREDAAVLRARLQRAAHEIDLAAVVTIHGFCARVLAEHALETGQAFVAPEMIGSDRALRDEIATDLWRALGEDALLAGLLQAQWPDGPEALAADLGLLLRDARLLPPPPPATPDPLPAWQRAAAAVRERFAQHGDDARAALEAAIAAKALNGNSYKAGLPAELWRGLASWCAQRDAATDFAAGLLDPRIERLTPATLALRTNKGRDAQTPRSPLFDAIAALLAARAQRAHWLAAQGIALVHRVRDQAAARMAALKRGRRVQTYDDLIDGVAAALDGAHGPALVARLRAQYAAALVDEFQDTDARQWGIFARVFGTDAGADAGADAQGQGAAARLLVLIGDPKQAIYGFRGGDVHTYLAAARQAQPAPALEHNFRSRPALLRAVAALYAAAGDAAFVDPRIRFRDVRPGGIADDAGLQRDGVSAPALTIHPLPAPGDDSLAWSAGQSRALAAAACVAAIHGWLGDSRAGRARIDGRALQPGDIAVLVRSNGEAARIQQALAAAGIAAVAAGRQSVFATEQAQELLGLLDALLHPGDPGRLRTALASVFLGLDAQALARGDDDAAWQRETQLRAQAWRERWQRHGPLALVADLCAAHAPRLLALRDGERRLTNLLQLGELLQEADARALGMRGLFDWLRARTDQADDNDETQQLRLESDARCVQILTLHKSKGLEFGLVFLPFAAIGRDPRMGPFLAYPDAGGRVLQLDVEHDDAATPTRADARDRVLLESRAEEARLLYVGLTRARHALWLAGGALYQTTKTALGALLAAAMADTGGARALHCDAGPLPATPLAPLPPEAAAPVPPARQAQRVLDGDWWIYSFTQLTRAAPGAPDLEAAAADEPEPAPALAALSGNDAAYDARFAGSRFGNVLHGALELVDFAAWRDCGSAAPSPGELQKLRAALRSQGYLAADVEDGLAPLSRLVARTLNQRLPEGVRLCELPAAARRAEMEFHFALAPTSVDALLATLHAHGWLRARHAFGARRRLEGLMTGKIDLVYVHDHRYYLLDYKSNRLPAYDAASLERAMEDSEYTLQAVIYTLALHRWLRFRLGAAYDYARDFGGVRYLFCRGLDAADSAAGAAAVGTAAVGTAVAGMYAAIPPHALVAALDRLFAAGSGP